MDNTPTSKPTKLSSFQFELASLLNKHSLENYCNTPDFIIAEYLTECFKNYCKTKQDNDHWHKSKTA